MKGSDPLSNPEVNQARAEEEAAALCESRPVFAHLKNSFSQVARGPA